MYTFSNKRLSSKHGGGIRKSLIPGFLVGAVTAFAVPTTAQALTIIPSYNEGALPAAVVNVINTAIGFYQSTF